MSSVNLSDLLKLLNDTISFRPEEVAVLVRRLEKFHQSINNASQLFHDADEKYTQNLISLAVQAYIGAITSVKLARSLEKVYKSFPKQFVDDIERCIQNVFKDHIASQRISNINTVSALLDQNASVKKLVQQEMFESVSFLLHALTSVLSDSEDSTTTTDRNVYTSVKLSVQVIQLLTPAIRASLSQQQDSAQDIHHSTQMGQGSSVWRDIAQALIQLFFKSSNRDLLLLLGTSLAMLFKTMLAEDDIGSVYKDLLLTLEKGKESFTIQGLTVQTKPFLSQQVDVSNHQAAVIKGLLIMCTPSVLCKGTGPISEPLMLTVFPYITQLCHGQTTHLYIAFQLLALWFQKLDACNLSLFTSDSLEKIKSVIDKSRSANKLNCNTNTNVPISSVIDESRSSNKLNCNTNTNVQISSVTKNSNQGHGKCDMMTSDCPILRLTLKLVWLNWDSPVDGVTEYAVDIFRNLLKVWHNCITSEISSYTSLAESLLEHVLTMPWHSKTRYPPLRLLLPYVDISQLFGDKATINEDLLKCLKSNNMAAVASDVYKSFLQIISATYKDKVLEIWMTTWMSSIFKGLTSMDSLQQLKTCTYWLPATLQFVPGSHTVLLQECAQRLNDGTGPKEENWLFAWVTISRTARDLLHSAVSLQPSPLLSQALRSDQESVRSEAIMLLCNTITRAEPVTELEVTLLKDFLPANLRTDSAPLRQQMTSALKKVIVRIRDSCITACRNKDRDISHLTLGIGFIDWLYSTLMDSLLPGGSYQRRQTCLDLLAGLLETLVYRDVTVARKGKAQESSSFLLQYAQNQGKWNFFNTEHLITLLVCLEDGADQIQRQSYNLVLQYYTEPLCRLLSDPGTVEHLVERALWRVDCHKAYQSHSGLLMLQLLFDRCLLEPNSNPLFQMSPSCQVILSKVKADLESPDPVKSFLTGLVSQLEDSLGTVSKDPAASFKLHPMHGLTQCISQGLQDISRANKSDATHQDLSCLLRKTLQLCQGIINLMLGVLAGREDQENCPSFADMGSALGKLVTTGPGQEEEEEELTTLSPEYQLVLSWCWINLRESCTCLGTVCEVAMQGLNSSLSEVELREVGDVYVKVLTTCRHRGAIEGCRTGFFQFCSSLLNSKSQQFSNIPKLILNKVLSDLSDNSLTASVTRRSAGLPIIVQTVLLAARSVGNTTLLLHTVDDLYTIASRPVHKDHDQQFDLCQSHALNILKVIFLDASLCGHLVHQLAKVSVLVVQGFDSPHWAIRNAATQLISTLVSRIFGQRSKSSTGSSTTLEEFESRYPSLMQCMCLILEDCLGRHAVSMRPSLYVVLTLLANLAMSPISRHSCRSREFLKISVSHFLRSPVHSLRKLSAQAFIALSPFDREEEVLTDVLQHIREERLSMNGLHGWCLVANSLLMSAAVGPMVSLQYLQFAVDHSWLFNLYPSCFTVPALVMETTKLVLEKATSQRNISSSDGEFPLLIHSLWAIVHRIFTFLCQDKSRLQVGREHCIMTCLELLSTLNHALNRNTDITSITKNIQNTNLVSNEIRTDCVKSDICSKSQSDNTSCLSSKVSKMNADPHDSVENETEQYTSVIVSGLKSTLVEVHECVLDLLSQGQQNLAASPSVQLCVWKVLLNTKQITHFHKCVTFLLQSALNDQLTIPSNTLTIIDLTNLKSVWGSQPGAKGPLFVLEGLIWAHQGSEHMKNRLPFIGAWCQDLSAYTSPTANENARLLAAQCLRLSGPNILNACCQCRNTSVSEDIVDRIVLACVVLLEDSESEVRHETTLFLCALAEAPPCHSNLAYSLLHAQIIEKFSWCESLLQSLLALVYSEHALTEAMRTVDRSASPLFEPEMESAMSEPPIRLLWAFTVLRSICSSKPNEIAADKILTVSQVAGLELKQHIPRLRKNLTENHLYSLTSQECVFKSLLGLRCLAVLEGQVKELFSQTPDRGSSGVDTSSLQSNIACLFQMSNIYPVLRHPSFLYIWEQQVIKEGDSLSDAVLSLEAML